MARILAISSQFSFGHIGLGATIPVLQRAGHVVISVPTVIVSNDPKFDHAARTTVSSGDCRHIVSSLEQNGLLANVASVFVGYMPTVEHVEFALWAIELVRRSCEKAIVVCDPILGDDPGGLYVNAGVADAIRQELSGRADILTPNRFELAWLSDCDVNNSDDAKRAAKSIGVDGILATSIPSAKNRIENLWIGNDDLAVTNVKRRIGIPHGVGDALAASFLGHFLNGEPPCVALQRATGDIDVMVRASQGRDMLDLFAT